MPNPTETLCIKCSKSTDCRLCRWDGLDLKKLPEGADYLSRRAGGSRLYCVCKCPEFAPGRKEIKRDNVQDENLLRFIERFCESLGANYRNALIADNKNYSSMYAREIRNSYLLSAAGIDAEAVIREIKAQVKAIKKAARRLTKDGDEQALRKLLATFPESAECIKNFIKDEPIDGPAPLYEDFTTYCRYYDIKRGT